VDDGHEELPLPLRETEAAQGIDAGLGNQVRQRRFVNTAEQR
jgi:hypothetical protein